MKTPMQEAIEKVQSLRQIDAVINPIGVIESILSNMLEKEKEMIMRTYQDGLDNGFINGNWNLISYYNETFNTKERCKE